MTVSTGRPSHSTMTAAHWLTGTATALTLFGLYVFDWWPPDFPDPSFLEYRTEYVEGLEDNTTPWWNGFHESYFQYGFGFQTAAFLVLPFVVGRRRWHWLAALAVLGAAWQLIGVLGSTIFHTTVAPFLGPLAGVLALIGWPLACSARRIRPASG